MKVEYTLTPELRMILKDPFGVLIEGSFDETMAKLKIEIEKQKPTVIVTVGDVVSRNLHDHKMHPQLSIIDYLSLRNKKTAPPKPHGEETVHVKNPSGIITSEAIEAVKKAIVQGSHTHIVVDGEEDLLTLIATMYAPLNSFVIYGQPNSGIVVVKVTLQKKEKVQSYLKAMKI
jgi:GTP-dependent dephospho-CoA kinase